MAGINLPSDEPLRPAQAGRASPDVAHDTAKWPARKTLLFIGGVSLVLWLAILFIAAQVLG